MKRLLLGLVLLMGASHAADATPKTPEEIKKIALIEKIGSMYKDFKASGDKGNPTYLGRTKDNLFFAKEDYSDFTKTELFS